MNNKVYSYYRVSSQGQEDGASLDAQKEANEHYAKERGLEIIEEFREVQSAAKSGRKEFTLMLKKLNKNVSGIIFHDVDRASRCFKDFGTVEDLVEEGYKIHFSRDKFVLDRENINDHGNFLLASFKMLMASAFVYNLRKEVKKGLYKRLEDGFCPIGKPPLGYLAKGKGVRAVDPLTSPLVKEVFVLYGSGKYSLEDLSNEMFSKGLRKRSGKKFDKNHISRILKNKFYIGINEVKGKLFKGNHEPLISVKLFDKVQLQLKKKCSPKLRKNKYSLFRMLKCGLCGRTLRATTARKKTRQYRYYWCRNKECEMKKSVREEEAEKLILKAFSEIKFKPEEIAKMLEIIKQTKQSLLLEIEDKKKSLKLMIGNSKTKLGSLLDMQLSNPLPQEMFNEKKNQLILEETHLKGELDWLEKDNSSLGGIEELIRLLENPVYAYSKADHRNKALLVDKMMKNIAFTQSDFLFEWQSPFDFLAKRNA